MHVGTNQTACYHSVIHDAAQHVDACLDYTQQHAWSTACMIEARHLRVLAKIRLPSGVAEGPFCMMFVTKTLIVHNTHEHSPTFQTMWQLTQNPGRHQAVADPQ